MYFVKIYYLEQKQEVQFVLFKKFVTKRTKVVFVVLFIRYLVRGRLTQSYRVSTYRQDIHTELPYYVVSLTLKTDCRQTF